MADDRLDHHHILTRVAAERGMLLLGSANLPAGFDGCAVNLTYRNDELARLQYIALVDSACQGDGNGSSQPQSRVFGIPRAWCAWVEFFDIPRT